MSYPSIHISEYKEWKDRMQAVMASIGHLECLLDEALTKIRKVLDDLEEIFDD